MGDTMERALEALDWDKATHCKCGFKAKEVSDLVMDTENQGDHNIYKFCCPKCLNVLYTIKGHPPQDPE
ncbi:hypothetical protein ACFL29_00040 [Patescibacteria group bacterium]